MSYSYATLSELSSDALLFPALQTVLILFVLFAWLLNFWHSRRAGHGTFSAQVTRGDSSMGYLYGTYAAISGLLIAICLSVDIATKHRVLWVVVDAGLVFYVCLLNPWFRNRLLEWVNRLPKIEKR